MSVGLYAREKKKKNLIVCYLYQLLYIYIEEISQKKIKTMWKNVDDIIHHFIPKPKKSS